MNCNHVFLPTGPGNMIGAQRYTCQRCGIHKTRVAGHPAVPPEPLDVDGWGIPPGSQVDPSMALPHRTAAEHRDFFRHLDNGGWTPFQADGVHLNAEGHSHAAGAVVREQPAKRPGLLKRFWLWLVRPDGPESQEEWENRQW